jgi:hypothetical protein
MSFLVEIARRWRSMCDGVFLSTSDRSRT